MEGPTELRSSWKYNDLKPRVYYAQGPDAYFGSRFIQQLFNKMVDAFPTTNRYTRFSINSLESLTPNDIMFIYDYSSFTSSLSELKNFTQALANFFRGVDVTIVRSDVGPTLIDLGDLLDNYNATCNINPEYDVGPISEMAESRFSNDGRSGFYLE